MYWLLSCIGFSLLFLRSSRFSSSFLGASSYHDPNSRNSLLAVYPINSHSIFRSIHSPVPYGPSFLSRHITSAPGHVNCALWHTLIQCPLPALLTYIMLSRYRSLCSFGPPCLQCSPLPPGTNPSILYMMLSSTHESTFLMQSIWANQFQITSPCASTPSMSLNGLYYFKVGQHLGHTNSKVLGGLTLKKVIS